MKHRSSVLVLLVVVLLVGATAILAAETTKKTAAPKEITGTVTSFTATSLVVSHSWMGKKSDRTFAIDPETQMEGTLAVGAKVKVSYRTEGKSHIATSVRVEETKQAAKEASKTATQKPKH